LLLHIFEVTSFNCSLEFWCNVFIWFFTMHKDMQHNIVVTPHFWGEKICLI
jgi:hypothetical protein